MVQRTSLGVLEQVNWLLRELVGRNIFSTFVFPALVLGSYSIFLMSNSSYSRMYMWNICTVTSRDSRILHSVEQTFPFSEVSKICSNVITVGINIFVVSKIYLVLTVISLLMVLKSILEWLEVMSMYTMDEILRFKPFPNFNGVSESVSFILNFHWFCFWILECRWNDNVGFGVDPWVSLFIMRTP